MASSNKEKLSPRVIVKIVLLISLLVLLILTPIIYSGVTYIKAWNKNVVPFEPTVEESTDSTTTTSTEEKKTTPKITGVDLTNVKRMDNKDFNLFNITFQATNYNDRTDEGKQNVTFKIVIERNENSPTLTYVDSGSTYLMKTGVCLHADWIAFESYQSSLSTYTDTYLKAGNTGKPTFSVPCKTQFPAKADTWPVKVTVDSPDAYLYILYKTQENGVTTVNSYILKYTYEEYMTSSTTGGIIK